MRKRFKGRGRAKRCAYIGENVTINGYVGRSACVGDGATVGGRVEYMADVGAGAVIEVGAAVELNGTVRERTIIKSGVVVPAGADIHAGYIVHAVLSAGLDTRGYHVIAVLCQERNDDGPSNPMQWRVMAGCRDFTFDEALFHWGKPNWGWGGNPDIAAKVAYLKKAVKIWEKENGKLGRRR